MKQDVRSLRKVIINAILATDMADHFNLCKRLDVLLAQAEPVTAPSSELSAAPPTSSASDPQAQWNAATEFAVRMCAPDSHVTLFDSSKADDRQLMCATLVHAADLSGQVYHSVQIAQEWERRISAQTYFFCSLSIE